MTRVPFLIASVLILVGCETTFEIDPPEHDPLVVVNSLVEAGKPFAVELGQSYGANDEVVYRFPGAKVVVFEDGNLREELVSDSTGRRHQSESLVPVPGRTYTLRAVVPGRDPVEATDTVPEKPNGSINVELLPDKDHPYASTYHFYRVTVHIDDPGGRDNFYAISVRTVEYAGGNVIGEGRHGFRSDDRVLRDSDVTEALRPQELYYDLAQFSDREIDGKNYGVRFTLQVLKPEYRWSDPDFPTPDRVRYYVSLKAVSETYYHYLKAVALTETDSPFAEPVQLPTNVRGGLGIVGASNELELLITELNTGDTGSNQ